MRLVPCHPSHQAYIDIWAKQFSGSEFEAPDMSKPNMSFTVLSSEEPVGVVQLFNLTRRTAHVGIVVINPFAAVKSARKILEIAFDALEVEKVIARVINDNQGPINLLHRFGFIEVRTDDVEVFRGKYIEMPARVFELRRQDFRRG